MLSRLFAGQPEEGRIASALYGTIVAQARNPGFYAGLGVPDTVRGRFEMVVLHTVLAVRRLRAGDERDGEIGQFVFDAFCADMDRSLREMGIGDLAVPKRMRGMAESFYGRAESYGTALTAGDTSGFAAALGRNVFEEPAASPKALSLARYAVAAANAIAGQTTGMLIDRPLPFPDPAKFA